MKSYLNRFKGNEKALAIALPTAVVVPLLIMTLIGGPLLLYFWIGIVVGMVSFWWVRRGQGGD